MAESEAKITDMTNVLSFSDVATKHPDYEKTTDSWQLIEDCLNGEKAVKDEGIKYLPRPSGMPPGGPAYISYITRAHFPDFTSKFLSGLTGVTKINPPKVKLPKSLEYLKEDADGNGTPLDTFFFQSVRLALKAGRQLIFVDINEEKNRLKLVRYTAKELINWGVVKKVYNDKNADFYVLQEKVSISDNIFTHEYENQYRVLSTQDVLIENGSKEFLSTVFNEEGILKEGLAVPKLMGKAFEGLPVVIIGSTDLGMEMDQIPLLGVSKCALQMFMKDADLSNAMFMTCNPTLVLSGVTKEENQGSEVLAGSNIAITTENPDARAYYTKTDASGLAEVRLRINGYLEEAKHAGSALLSGDQKGVESGEALRIKSASTTASLSTVSQTTARGFEKCIRNMAKWMAIKEDLVSVKVDSDYLDNMLTPEYIKQLVDLFGVGVLTHETVLQKLVEGKFLDEDFNIKKEILETKKISEEKEKKEEDNANKESQKLINNDLDPALEGTSGLLREDEEIVNNKIKTKV